MNHDFECQARGILLDQLRKMTSTVRAETHTKLLERVGSVMVGSLLLQLSGGRLRVQVQQKWK
jgi:hypothetical protein